MFRVLLLLIVYLSAAVVFHPTSTTRSTFTFRGPSGGGGVVGAAATLIGASDKLSNEILTTSYHVGYDNNNNISGAAAADFGNAARRNGNAFANDNAAHEPTMADVIAVKEGADLDLSCPIVVHSEDMIISWMCDNEPAGIKSSRIHVIESGKLRIRSAKVGDSCNYRCEAADGFGTLSVVIKVIIVDKRLMEQLTRSTSSSGPNATRASSASYLSAGDTINGMNSRNIPASALNTDPTQGRKLQTASALGRVPAPPQPQPRSPSSSLSSGQLPPETGAYKQPRPEPNYDNRLVDGQVSGVEAATASNGPVQWSGQLLPRLQSQSSSAPAPAIRMVHANNEQQPTSGPNAEGGTTVLPTSANEPNQSAEVQKVFDPFQVEIEPSRVHIAKNKSFSLECRVRYGPNSRAPQILWLKEFIGRRPDSFIEQLEQNLILIDGLYYYTLNWPRSITYSHLFATANSALIVKHSSFVHSGKYICFAGSLPAVLHPSDSWTMNGTKTETSDGERDLLETLESSPTTSPVVNLKGSAKNLALKYRMAQAVVLVDDPVDELEYKARMLNGPKLDQRVPQSAKSVLAYLVNGSVWFKSILLILLLVCVVLIVAKFSCQHDDSGLNLSCMWRLSACKHKTSVSDGGVDSAMAVNGRAGGTPEPSASAQLRSDEPQEYSVVVKNLQNLSNVTHLLPKEQHTSPSDAVGPDLNSSTRTQRQTAEISSSTGNRLPIDYDKTHSFVFGFAPRAEQKNEARNKTKDKSAVYRGNDRDNDYDDDNISNHLYSEITCLRDNNQSSPVVIQESNSSSTSHYKTPVVSIVDRLKEPLQESDTK